MFQYINLENCTLINCKTDNLEYINIPHDKNIFINMNELNLNNSTNIKESSSKESLEKFTYKDLNNKSKPNLKVFDKNKLKDKSTEISKGNGLGE